MFLGVVETRSEGWFADVKKLAEPEIIFNHSQHPGRSLMRVPLSTLRAAHEGWLPSYMKGGAV